MYKKVLIMGMLFLSSLNFCFGANIQCWEENINPWVSKAISNTRSNSNNFAASDSKLYNTLKDKATVVFVGVSAYSSAGGTTSDSPIAAMPYSYITGTSYEGGGRYHVDMCSLALKFCAVFNDSGSSSSSTSSTAAVNYIIKAK